MQKNTAYWKGQDVSTMTKPELMDALLELAMLYKQALADRKERIAL